MSASRITAGTVLGGRYVLDKLLGEGSFGQVWVATDPRAFNRRVAVKVLMEEHLANRDIVARFRREGEATAVLSHPNVVALLEFGEQEGIPYLISEFVPGRTLRRMLEDALERGQYLTLDEALSVFRQLCSGVAAAHDKNIVHRDLKPENVMVQGEGTGAIVKVLDFGIARILTGGVGGANAQGRTESGRILGSLQYMAPEQVLGDIERIGPATDVFALGAILYELLTLQPVFASEAFHAVVSQIIGAERPRLDAARPGLSAGLDEVLQRALLVNPVARYADAHALLEATEAASREPLELTSSPRLGTLRPGARADDLEFKQTIASSNAPSKQPPSPIAPALPEAPAPPPATPSRLPLALGAGFVAVALCAAGLVAMRGGLGGSRTSTTVVTNPVNARDAALSMSVSARDAAAALAPEASVATAPQRPEDAPADWVTFAAPAAPVALGRSAGSAQTVGFAPEAHVSFAGPGFQLHAREVTWASYERWAAERAESHVAPPSWVPHGEHDSRAQLPVCNATWEQARAFCRALGGDLPTEEQWEYAVRGVANRSNPWGNGAAPASLNAFHGAEATLRPVGVNPADRTPEGVFDLAGNALEWTSSRFRTDDGASPAWTVELRTIRGFPLREARPVHALPAVAPFRNSGCIGTDCNAADRVLIESVGFRCARPLP